MGGYQNRGESLEMGEGGKKNTNFRKTTNFSYKTNTSGYVMYSLVTVVNNTVLYI